jgi:hypothetical protein
MNPTDLKDVSKKYRRTAMCTTRILALVVLVSLALTPGMSLASTAGLPPQAASHHDAISHDWLSAVHAQISQSEYNLSWQAQTGLLGIPAAYHAPNRAYNLRTYFTSSGLVTIPRDWSPGAQTPPWRWSLSLSTWGRQEALQSISPAAPTVQANQASYSRGDLTEGYANNERGLQQTLHIATAPPGAGQLAIIFTAMGDLSPSLTTNKQELDFISEDSHTILHYGNLQAKDALGRLLSTRLTASRQGFTLFVSDTRATYPLTIHALITSESAAYDGLIIGDQDNSMFGYAVSTAGDVNGDGYSDVIIGAFYYDYGALDKGAAFVFLGSAAGINTTQHFMTTGNQENALLGFSVSTAGDVNGDGYGDVIIGEPNYVGAIGYTGGAFIYYGSATGLSLSNVSFLEGALNYDKQGYAVGTAGDVNGDGYSDVMLGGEASERVYVFYGSASGLPSTASWIANGGTSGFYFGRALDTAGDVNADGYDDIIIGQYGNGAYVYYGSPTGLDQNGTRPSGTKDNADWQAHGTPGVSFGKAVGTAGDVNGDGHADIIIGDEAYPSSSNPRGAAYVYYGSPTGLNKNGTRPQGDSSNADWSWIGTLPGAIGSRVGTAGDVNGDGFGDILVDNTNIYIFEGSASGLPTTANRILTGASSSGFGISVSTAGDVNGDGYSDTIVGAPYYGSTSTGAAFLFHGSPSPLQLAAAWSAEGDKDNASFGTSAAAAGDVNGDGYADVLVGAEYFDDGQANQGKVFFYFGSPTGLPTVPDWTAVGESADTNFGQSVSTAGDVNGDGYDDILIGTGYAHTPDTYHGAAYLFQGSPSGPAASPTWSAFGDQNFCFFGSEVSNAGDVNGDGYGDILIGASNYDHGQTDEGAAFAYYGSPSGLDVNGLRPVGSPSNADWMGESNQDQARFSQSALNTAGDVNGDGFSDIIVGAFIFTVGGVTTGAAFVYYGSYNGLSQTPNWTTFGPNPSYYGYAASTAGDVNGDGYSDVVIGAPLYSINYSTPGAVYAYYGSSSGLPTSYNWMYVAQGSVSQASLGQSADTAGDVNGDGFTDLIVGAPSFNNSFGRAMVFPGSATGLPSTPSWFVEGTQSNEGLGVSVGTVGDVNGDGYADVIVGSPNYDNGQTGEGRAQVFYGYNGTEWQYHPQQMLNGSTPLAHLGGLDPASVLQLSLFGRNPLGRQDVKLEWQLAPLGVPFTSPSALHGMSPTWTDVLTTGVPISITTGSLVPGTPYHWRTRIRFPSGSRLGQPGGRWLHLPWHAFTEQDFRTQSDRIIALRAGNDSPTELGNPTALQAKITSGKNVSYAWTFGDGDSGTGASNSHTYATVGAYTAIVTATNSVNSLTTHTIVNIYETTTVPPGGIYSSSDQVITMTIPSSLSFTPTITYTPQITPTYPIGSFNCAGITFSLKAVDQYGQPIINVSPPITLTISYDPADLQPGMLESDLQVMRYDVNWVKWFALTVLQRDTVAHTLTVSLDHFSEFALLVQRKLFLPLIMKP